MSKHILCIAAVAAFTSVFPIFAQEQQPSARESTWKDKIIMYLPNRILDLTDMISLETGLGYNGALNVYLTRRCVFGASYGEYAALGKDYNRQIGAFIEEGWNADFIAVGAENKLRYDTWGTMEPFWIIDDGPESPCQYIYESKIRDYNAIGFDAGCILNCNFRFHPMSCLDFFAGLIFFDPEHDDLTYSTQESCPAE